MQRNTSNTNTQSSDNNAEKIRAFIAIDIDSRTRQTIEELSKKLRFTDKGITWVKPSLMHLSLKFLGDINIEEVDKIVEALNIAKKSVTGPFNLSTDKVSAFPNLHTPKVLFVGLKENKNLIKLRNSLEEELNKISYPLENKQFTPHITICRVRKPILYKEVREEVNLHQDFESTTFKVPYITFYKSTLTQKGAIYEAIKKIDL